MELQRCADLVLTLNRANPISNAKPQLSFPHLLANSFLTESQFDFPDPGTYREYKSIYPQQADGSDQQSCTCLIFSLRRDVEDR